jgi:hypothetical protein
MRKLLLIVGTFAVAASSGAQTTLTADELSDVVATFDVWSAKDLAALNTELATKNLQPIVLITRQDWEAVGKSGQ